jgi:hypothetical protein
MLREDVEKTLIKQEEEQKRQGGASIEWRNVPAKDNENKKASVSIIMALLLLLLNNNLLAKSKGKFSL